MTLEQLLRDGEILNTSFYEVQSSNGFVAHTKTNDEAKCLDWMNTALKYLEYSFPGDSYIEEFQRVMSSYHKGYSQKKDQLRMISILRGLYNVHGESLIQTKTSTPLEEIIERICMNFSEFDQVMGKGRKGQTLLEIRNEYDQQRALHAVLKLFVADIREEDYVPSYAGGNSRIDFYIPDENLYIETKMTRDGLTDKELGNQLAIDTVRYKGKADCSHVIFFVYDKSKKLRNAKGIAKDIEKLSTDDLKFTVHISN